MSISLLLEIRIRDPDRLRDRPRDVRLTTQELSDLADGGAGVIEASGCEHRRHVGASGAMPCCCSRRPGRARRSPINYRSWPDGCIQVPDRASARTKLVIVDARYRDMIGSAGKTVLDSEEFLAAADRRTRRPRFPTPTPSGLVLFTSRRHLPRQGQSNPTTTRPVTSPARWSSVPAHRCGS